MKKNEKDRASQPKCAESFLLNSSRTVFTALVSVVVVVDGRGVVVGRVKQVTVTTPLAEKKRTHLNSS